MEFFISHLLFIIGFSLTPCLLRINNLCYSYFFGVSARRMPCRAIFVKSQSSGRVVSSATLQHGQAQTSQCRCGEKFANG